jgi:ABC-type glycerol-3-phosphate transport system substrate-binding protein
MTVIRNVFRLTLLGVLALFASACAGNVSPATPPPNIPATTEPVALTLWHTETGAAKQALEDLARDFQKNYPNIKLDLKFVGDESNLFKQSLAAVQMAQPPDLATLSRTEIATLARAHGLRALDDLIADQTVGISSAEQLDFFPGLLDSTKFPALENRSLAVPFKKSAVVLYYNADLLRAAKFDHPPQTWDLFRDMALKVTKDDQRGWVMLPDAVTFDAMLFTFGGAPIDQPEKRSLFAESPGSKSMAIVSQLSKAGATIIVNTPVGARAEFARGKSAFLFASTADLPWIAEAVQKGANFQWALTNIPQNDPAHPVTALLGPDFAVFKTTPERERAAWTFVRWFTAPEQTARWARATGAIPLRASSLKFLAPDLITNPTLAQIRAGWGDTVPDLEALPSYRNLAKIDELIEDAWHAVATGQSEAQPALDNAAAQADQILATNP